MVRCSVPCNKCFESNSNITFMTKINLRNMVMVNLHVACIWLFVLVAVYIIVVLPSCSSAEWFPYCDDMDRGKPCGSSNVGEGQETN